MKPKTWEKKAGRAVTRNGVEVFTVDPVPYAPRSGTLTPVEADDLTDRIVVLLNGPQTAGEFVDRLTALIDVAGGSDVLPCGCAPPSCIAAAVRH